MPFEPSSSHICRPANGEACFKSFQHESFPASDRRKAPATKTREAQTTTRVRKVEMAALENPTLDQAGGGQHATCSCVQPKSGEVPTKKKKNSVQGHGMRHVQVQISLVEADFPVAVTPRKACASLVGSLLRFRSWLQLI